MKKILISLFTILAIIILTYFAVFGRALKQQENHLAIMLILPKTIFSSQAVRIDNNSWLTKNTTEFIKAMENQGFTYLEQMGSGHFLKKDSVSYISESRMYSSHFMIFTNPKIINKTTDTASNPEWIKINQAILDCQVTSIMQTHSKIVTTELKDGRKIEAQEPNIDDIMKIAAQMKKKCGKIIMATE